MSDTKQLELQLYPEQFYKLQDKYQELLEKYNKLEKEHIRCKRYSLELMDNFRLGFAGF